MRHAREVTTPVEAAAPVRACLINLPCGAPAASSGVSRLEGAVKDLQKLGIGSRVLLAHFYRCEKRNEQPTPKMIADAKRFGVNPKDYGYKSDVR